MPNHCYNRVTFYSDDKEKEIKKLHDIFSIDVQAEDEERTIFGQFIPEPDWPTTPLADRWYDWRLRYWDTKWDCYDLEIDEDDLPHGFEVQFCTAWSPPEGICTAMREQYPDIDISWFYDEPGEGIAGYL
jgi:hypothetical protein